MASTQSERELPVSFIEQITDHEGIARQKVQQEKVTTLKRQNAKEKKRAVSAQGAACTVATKAALDGSAIQLSKLTNGRSPSFFVKVKNSGPPTPIQLKSLPAC